jgi:hypothetical protein
MAIPKLNVNNKPNVPTKRVTGNASTSVPAKGAGTRPVSRAAPPRLVNVPTKKVTGTGGANVGASPASARKPARTPPGPYGQPVVSRGTIGLGGPTSVSPAPPQKKGSPGLVGGGTVGKPVTGTMLKSMSKGPILPKNVTRAARLSVGNPRNRGKG